MMLYHLHRCIDSPELHLWRAGYGNELKRRLHAYRTNPTSADSYFDCCADFWLSVQAHRPAMGHRGDSGRTGAWPLAFGSALARRQEPDLSGCNPVNVANSGRYWSCALHVLTGSAAGYSPHAPSESYGAHHIDQLYPSPTHHRCNARFFPLPFPRWTKS